MFLRTQFPHLWFAVEGTFKRLSLILAEVQLAPEIDRAIEILRTREQLQEQFSNIEPFASHFTHSLALKAPSASALKTLKQRVEALAKFESRFDAMTAARHTAFDLNSAWGESKTPEPADISYLQILIERLDLSLLAAQSKGACDIAEVIIAVKGVLADFLSEYQKPDQDPDYSSEFLELQR